MTPEETSALIRVLDRAFDTDPILGSLLSEKKHRARAATALHRAAVNYAVRFGVLEIAAEGAGVALWLPPGREHLTFPRMLQTGFVPLALELGWALPRLLKIDHVLTQMHTTHAPEKHWYLFFLAVDPAAHGKGIGGALLEQGVVRAEAQGLPVYLETQTEQNVRFYTRRGFVVKEEKTIAPGLTNWALRRG
ncbi:GNAT family N-acetyltransferase [Armatimonas sp.]|uniref:GNAT family N-acetyltransferase n=1 Tax=Armatimonas sp. TaxID=1872638 RepID=UPI0037533FCF